MSNKKVTYNITGMHCRSCEIILEKRIRKIHGVEKVRTNFKKGTAEIEYKNEPDPDEIVSVIKAAGYNLGKEGKKPLLSKDPMDYLELLGAATLLLIIYAALDSSGLLNLNLNVSGTPGLVGVLLIGLTAGVSTCMALIGGLVLGISSSHAELHPEATTSQKFRPHIFFNLGRIISYFVLGGMIGLVGSALKLSSSVLGYITIVLGFVMLFLGFKIIEIFPRLHNKSISLPKSISRMFGIDNEIKEYSHRGSFVTGALTFFIPCGFTQAMQLYAVSTGSFIQGALIMGMFALGTLPGIIGIGGLTSAIKGAFARYFFKFAGLVVIALAVFNIGTGWNLSGLTFPNSNENFTRVPSSTVKNEIKLENGKQIIEMTQAGNGYSPRQFTVKKDVPVVWKINSTNQYTCAANINLPALDISQPLEAGMNVIEFIPTKTGSMRFTCSMGMYSGNFNVID